MNNSIETIIKAWIAVAWVDGDFCESEKQHIQQKFIDLGIDVNEFKNEFKQPIYTSSLDIQAITSEFEKQLLLGGALAIACIDGGFSNVEKDLIISLQKQLNFSEEKFQLLLKKVENQYKSSLSYLKSNQ
ncbi:MAG: hypothetical protein COB02_01865 [Candidatus Cloacimonadota bacterium]|nr:MAG: hypothetical protein COB02_01865 [Candidatus Cloacimonadota bacterium]